MFVSRSEAKAQIEKIKKGNPVKTGLELPIRKGTKFNVYKIPVEILAPNVLNDRIAWKIREFEASEKRKLTVDKLEDIEYVYSLIEEESPKDNENTLKDLANKGQLIDGIITNNGIIIDGNRRSTLIRKLFRGDAIKYGKTVEDFRFFNAIVLDEDIDEREIMTLETRLQIGEDKKVDYNPINIYIKVDNLTQMGYNEKQIADFMNYKPSEVSQKKEIFSLMNEYLQSIERENYYTLLDGLEDHFINTITIFKRLDNNTYKTEDWDYTDNDITDFKAVCYDYMRSKYEGKKYREQLLGRPQKTDGVFIKKDVWKNFLKNHENIIDKNRPENENDWQKLAKEQFSKNLRNATEQLEETKKLLNITDIINRINNNAEVLINLLKEENEINSDDSDKLKEIVSKLNSLSREFK